MVATESKVVGTKEKSSPGLWERVTRAGHWAGYVATQSIGKGVAIIPGLTAAAMLVDAGLRVFGKSDAMTHVIDAAQGWKDERLEGSIPWERAVGIAATPVVVSMDAIHTVVEGVDSFSDAVTNSSKGGEAFNRVFDVAADALAVEGMYLLASKSWNRAPVSRPTPRV